MAQRTDIFDVGQLGLSSGEGRSIRLEVPVDPFDFGGQRYEVEGGQVDARLDVSHTVSGYAFRLLGAEHPPRTVIDWEPGTAVVHLDGPVEEIHGAACELRSPEGTTAAPASTELTMRIRDALVGMQFGRAEDTFGWMHQVV